jgi:hypothetical protein
MNVFARLLLGLFFTLSIASPAVAEEEDQDWTDRIDLYGDFRLRYEGIESEGFERRDRSRFRARFGVTGQVNDSVKVIFQLCSGGDNPVSCNQSFDEGVSTKDLSIDLAYVDWQATDELNVYAGKMKNPLYRAGSAPLVWDGDLNLEGFSAKYSGDLFFATLGAFSIEERAVTDDSLMYAGQFGMTFGMGKKSKLTAGLGYFAYTNTIGNEPFFFGIPLGNSVNGDGNYIYDYKDTEVFAQFDSALRNWPLSIYAHVVQNNGASEGDMGYAVGAKLGAAKAKGKLEFSWTYMDVEADSVVAAFNDSDFAGARTDSSGSLIKAKYALAKNIILGGTFFVNEIDKSSGDARDYDRLQLDIEFKFK